MSLCPTLLWFRNDLRLADNCALSEAAVRRAPVIMVYIHDELSYGMWKPGAASKWFLHRALLSLQTELRERGGDLVVEQGDSLVILRNLLEITGASAVYWNRCYESSIRERDALIKKALREDGIEVKSFNSSLLHEPHTVCTGNGQPYKVYTPYWRKVKDRTLPPPVETDWEAFSMASAEGLSHSVESLRLLPEVKWYKKFESQWEVSEAGAKKRLLKFLEGPVHAYDTNRDLPELDGTSALSPYLHCGLIGPRQVMHELGKSHDLREKGPQVFSKEIYWREFAYNVLYHFPHTPDAPLQEKYADFPWKSDDSLLEKWQRGMTGYPIVDAGMRQLYETGWMHNRVRMIVSSLLVKHLLQDWKAGARWFWDTLVDADLASNTLGWQWSGGCGADAAPYFRIFNPITQGKKFDPEGNYVRRWVPELSRVPGNYIHEPWTAPVELLQRVGCRLGEDYPEPIIEHKEGRARALAAFDKVKG